MTNSDIIAIIAISVSGLVSIVTLIASFYTNRANNRAKLSEIAFEKRIEILREVFEAIHIHTDNMLDYSYAFSHKNHGISEEKISQAKIRYEKSEDKFRGVFRKNRAFFTKEIDNEINLYIRNIQHFPDELLLLEDMGKGSNLAEGESISRITMYASRVLDKIQQFIDSK